MSQLRTFKEHTKIFARISAHTLFKENSAKVLLSLQQSEAATKSSVFLNLPMMNKQTKPENKAANKI